LQGFLGCKAALSCRRVMSRLAEQRARVCVILCGTKAIQKQTKNAAHTKIAQAHTI